MNNVQLYKPNELISVISSLELNRTARHLFNYFLQHAQYLIKFENYQSNTFKININELNELAEIHQKNYKFIAQALDNLLQFVTLTNDKRHYIRLAPVTYINVNHETGEYIFRLEEKVIELLRCNDYFTKLDLLEFNPLKSKHSLIIFEHLKRYENLKQIPVLAIDELRAITDTTDKYKNFKHLQQYVLDVAVSEINEFTNYNCSYELIKSKAKTRYKVTAIQFHLVKKENKQNQVIVSVEISKEYKDLFKKLKAFFSDLSEQDFNFSTYIYTYKTLQLFEQFLSTKTYKNLSRLQYFQYLSDKANTLSFYQRRNITFASSDDVISYFLTFAERMNIDIHENMQEIQTLANQFCKYDYVTYCTLLSDLFFKIFNCHKSDNAFSIMLDRMK